MVHCKFCNAEIDRVLETRTGVQTSEIYLEDNCLKWEGEYFEGDDVYYEYLCPECKNELDINDEVESFLKDEDKLQRVVREKMESKNE